jgi:hypothetical protein
VPKEAKLKCSSKIEIVGMVLVLLSAAWSLFFSDALNHLFLDSSFYRVDEKLNTIWFTLADLYSNSASNDSGASSSTNFKNALQNWKDWRQDQEQLRYQKSLFATIGGVIFIFGSVLVIWGKIKSANGD